MVDDDTIEEMRNEMERAAGDLERITEQLHERSVQVERLEALVDHMLGLIELPVVVVGADRKVSAVSRGAAALLPQTSRVLGKNASSVLPRPLADRLAAFADKVAAAEGTEDDSPASGGLAEGNDLVALPGGATLVVLGE
jgi:PAS domain-containing protein